MDSGGLSHAGQALISDVEMPKSAVAWSVREEWATRLEDVVERRLMLVFDERLSRRSLEDIAAVLVGEGVLEKERAAAEVETVAARLRQRYGKTLEGTSA
jgi:glycerol-3-phosphate dehydrogenase